MQSVNSELNQQDRSVAATSDTRGKHRISAELKRVEQEARSLEINFASNDRRNNVEEEEELEQLEKMENASAACEEMLSNVEAKSDPLLPITNGPANPSWDQWFERPQDSSGCSCWIF